jgi:crossover junction endodeoxyribonuclease RuvC
MIVIGIDPGTLGAYAVLGTDGTVEVDDLPTHQIGRVGTKTLRSELSLHAIRSILRQHRPDHVVIEQTGPMPRQGITSTWRFAYSCGGLYGLVVAIGVPCSFVRPKIWQRYHGIGPEPGAALRRALQLYPDLTEELGRKKDHHKADALLIGLYGRHALRPAEAA